MVERHVHKGESGNKETPNHIRNPITNSGPGIAKPRLIMTRGIALSQPLLVPEGCDKAVKQLQA